MPYTDTRASKGSDPYGPPSESIEEWDAWAETYEETAGFFTRINESLLLDVLSPKGKRILDAGCGTGRLCHLLAQRDAEAVVGIDASGNMIEKARTDSRPNTRFERCSVYDLPSDESFDIVVACYLLHHLDIQKALEALKGVLAPGGLLVILDPLKGNLYHRMKYLVLALKTFGVGFTFKVLYVRFTSLEWKLHDRQERLASFGRFREQHGKILPGADIRRVNALFGFITWRKAP